MKGKDDNTYREQILDAIEKIETSFSEISEEEFYDNQDKQSLAILQLIIIGELSKHISDAFKAKYDIPWKQIAGLRDRAVHDYFSLDLKQVWNTVQKDIPDLKKKLNA